MDPIQPLAAVVLVMALLGGALFALKRRGIASFTAQSARRVEVLERVALTPQHSIHVVRAQGRILLIATAPGSCQILDRDMKEGDGA
jgi:flagellar biogenesis protein FliO